MNNRIVIVRGKGLTNASPITVSNLKLFSIVFNQDDIQIETFAENLSRFTIQIIFSNECKISKSYTNLKKLYSFMDVNRVKSIIQEKGVDAFLIDIREILKITCDVEVKNYASIS